MVWKLIRFIRTKWTKILLVIFSIIALFLIILVISNALTREQFYLTSEQEQALLNFFPKSHIDNVKFYKGGTFSAVSTKTLCNSVYFNVKEPWDFFFENKSYPQSLKLLVHETTHTWQARKGCLKMSVNSLYSQFKSLLATGSTHDAYVFSANQPIYELNPEQEASIVDEYYWEISFEEELEHFHCIECINLTRDEKIEILKKSAEEVLSKYR